MKFAVLVLVLANLALFAWLRWARPGTPQPDFGLVPPATGGVAATIVGSAGVPGTAATAATAAPTRCLTAGPMTGVGSAAALAAQLGESGLAARTLVRAETVAGGYQVLISGLADRNAAGTAAAKLKNAGIADLAVRDDPQGGADVSLGVYRSLDDARERVVRIKKLGFEPQIRIRARTAPRWYLELPASQSAAAAARSAGVAVKAGLCTGAAPAPGSANPPASAASPPGTPSPASSGGGA